MFYAIRTISTSVTQIKNQNQITTTTQSKKTPRKSTTPSPKTLEEPDAYILILVAGNQTVLTKTSKSANKCVCVSVYITVLFFLSPIVLFGGYIFP